MEIVTCPLSSPSPAATYLHLSTFVCVLRHLAAGSTVTLCVYGPLNHPPALISVQADWTRNFDLGESGAHSLHGHFEGFFVSKTKTEEQNLNNG